MPVITPTSVRTIRGEAELMALAAELIASAILSRPPGEKLDRNDPGRWSAGFRRLVERRRADHIAEMRETPGVLEVEPDPSDPRGILVKLEAPVSYFEIRLADASGAARGKALAA